jgi:glucosamine-6-phosphate deaminase
VHVLRFDTAQDTAVALARAVARAIELNPAIVLGLPAGRTPVPVYAELGRLHRENGLDFSRVRTFNLDELAGIPAGHPGSFQRFMIEHLFSAVNVPRSHIRFLDGAAPDRRAECARYEAAIAEAGGIDLQVLGLGVNGHIGFNEPGDVLVAGTHLARLHEETRAANAHAFGGRVEQVPTEALSMGVGTILRASAIALIATGAAKSKAVRDTVRGPITTRVPASLLQVHRDVVLYLDEAAAAELDGD